MPHVLHVPGEVVVVKTSQVGVGAVERGFGGEFVEGTHVFLGVAEFAEVEDEAADVEAHEALAFSGAGFGVSDGVVGGIRGVVVGGAWVCGPWSGGGAFGGGVARA